MSVIWLRLPWITSLATQPEPLIVVKRVTSMLPHAPQSRHGYCAVLSEERAALQDEYRQGPQSAVSCLYHGRPFPLRFSENVG